MGSWGEVIQPTSSFIQLRNPLYNNSNRWLVLQLCCVSPAIGWVLNIAGGYHAIIRIIQFFKKVIFLHWPNWLCNIPPLALVLPLELCEEIQPKEGEQYSGIMILMAQETSGLDWNPSSFPFLLNTCASVSLPEKCKFYYYLPHYMVMRKKCIYLGKNLEQCLVLGRDSMNVSCWQCCFYYFINYTNSFQKIVLFGAG